jgi:hypothetical protein
VRRLLAKLLQALANRVSPAAPTPTAPAPAAVAPAKSGRPAYEEDVSKAIERSFATSRWALGAFGAVGAILAAGIQFSDLGRLSDHNRTRSVLAAVLGFGGVFLAIGAVVWLQRPFETDIFEVGRSRAYRHYRSKIDANPTLLAGQFTSIGSFVEDFRHRLNKFGAAEIAIQNGKAVEKNRAELAVLGPIISDRFALARVVISNARMYLFRRRFTRTLLALVLGAALAVSGLTLLALSSKVEPVSNVAAPVLVDLTPAGADAFRGLLGSQCVGGQFLALALNGTSGTKDLVVLPTASCRGARIELDSSLGVTIPG